MSLQLDLIGSPFLTVDNSPVTLPRSKAFALLSYLVATAQNHRRDSLVALLWPNYDQSSGRAELRRQLSTLRQSIGDDYLTIEREVVSMAWDRPINCDLHAVQRLLQECQVHAHELIETCYECGERLQQVAEHAQGTFMEGFTLPDSPAFDQWQYHQSLALQGQILNALDTLAHTLVNQENIDRAIKVWQQLLAQNPTYEPAHRHLMRYFAETGRRSEALRQYEACVFQLRSEFEIEPELETQKLYHLIKDQHYVTTQAVSATPVFTKKKARFPSPPTPFLIGRDGQLQQVLDYLRNPGCRLITVTGMGGIGKTHFVIELCQRVTRSKQECVFISLESVLPAYFFNALIETLDIENYAQRNPEKLILNHLRQRQMVLVLDSFERHMEHRSFIERLLDTAPDVRLIVTSRRRLQFATEYLLELEPLPYPEDDTPLHPETYPACQLFNQVAQRISSHYKPDDGVVARICARLGGLPLALQLAATWTRALSLNEILSALKTGLNILSDTPQDNGENNAYQRVFWESWELLSAPQQEALTRLTIFPGSFSAGVAQAILQLPINRLLELVDHSLLIYDTEKARFYIHSALRPHLVTEMANLDTFEIRFIDYYSDFLMARYDQMLNHDLTCLDEIEDELKNIQAAIQLAFTHHRVTQIGILIEAIYRLFEAKKALHAGLETFTQLTDDIKHYLETEPRDIHHVRQVLAATHARLAIFHAGIGNSKTVVETLEPYISFWRSVGNRTELAFTLNTLGMAYAELGQDQQAIKAYEEALSIRDKQGDRRGMARVCNNLGVFWLIAGEFEKAQDYFIESLSVYSQVHDYVSLARVCTNLGNLANMRGELTEAKMYYERALKLQTQHQFQSQWSIACTILNVGHIDHKQARHAEAKQNMYRAYALFNTIGHQERTAFALLDLAQVSLQLDQIIEAQRYLVEALQMTHESVDEMALSYVLLDWIALLRHLQDTKRAVAVAQTLKHSKMTAIKEKAERVIEEIQSDESPNAAPQRNMHSLAAELLVLYDRFS